MAFQTSVLRDGEWVTQTIDLQTVLKANTAAKPARPRPQKHTKCGIITRTVVESPVAHHILPCRLRSLQHADVAFVGDRFVQIRELRNDGQLQDIIHKNDFGDRIRNAKVIGSLPDSLILNREDVLSTHGVEAGDDGDIDMLHTDSSIPTSSRSSPGLAPQMLLVVLECGDCIFMVLRTRSDGRLEFVTSQVELPNVQMSYPGFHLAVDPSSRYVAVGCSESLFMVYELESREVLNRRYRRNEPLNPVKKRGPRPVNGLIHKMDFLFPRREDDYHIILLLIIVAQGMSKMVVYEWEAGDDLGAVLGEEKKGHRLPQEHQMPLLLIPLMVGTAFFAVYPESIAVGKDVLIGPPSFDTFQVTRMPPSKFHHGRGNPLWSTWTRPFRLAQFNKDWLYLAREDGVVVVLDIDSDSILNASQVVKEFECNISTAFCALFDQFADILIMGGDSGPGAVWQVLARQESVKLGVIPNWSPAVDFLTTDEFSKWNQGTSSRGNLMIPWETQTRHTYTPPDRIFAACGRGVTGTITEYRHGYQANIGLYFDCEPTTTAAWLLPIDAYSVSAGYYLLASMPDRSTILQLPSDLSEVDEPPADQVAFDLSSRTIAASRALEGAIVQVTENFIVCVSPEHSVRTLHRDLIRSDQTAVSHADILNEFVVLSTGSFANSSIHLLRILPDMSISAIRSFPVEGEVTCLSFATLSGLRQVFAGLWNEGVPSLAKFSLDGLDSGRLETVPIEIDALDSQSRPVANEGQPDSMGSSLEAFTSVAPLDLGHSHVIVFGTRNGEVLTMFLNDPELPPLIKMEKFGLTPATVCAANFNEQECALVCCDSALFIFTNFDAAKTKSFKDKSRVWPVHALDASQPTPPIHSVKVLESHITEDRTHLPILMAAGPHILMASVLPRPRPVPWCIPLFGTPLKVIHSHQLECLVVAVGIKDRTVLKFLDVDTGEEVSTPINRQGEQVEAIQGLDRIGDTILGLSEWIYQRESHTWAFVLVSTGQGELLVISTEKLPPPANGSPARVRYRTQYRKRVSQPIHSVIGHADGLIYCVGSTIKWDILDLAEKKLRPWRSFDMSTPVTTMRVVNERIVALTSQDSISIINPGANSTHGEMMLEHADPKSRPAMHMIELSGEKDGSGSSIMLLCDRASGVAGLWVPWQQPGRNCEVVFEADLPASVRRFRRGRTRPAWLRADRAPRYGALPSTVDGAEIIGLCLDGSLQHFTLINMEAWAVLRLVQNLALQSPTLCPFTYDMGGGDDGNNALLDTRQAAGSGGYEMHIDGDLMQLCLERRALAELFAKQLDMDKLGELLSALDDGALTEGITRGSFGSGDKYLEVVYDIMQYYLSPIM
ncbi:hypothetical protein RB601_003489 [Gaeumannomyces tritici]